MNTLHDLAVECGEAAALNGWHDYPADSIPTDYLIAKTALVAGEAHEAINELTKGHGPLDTWTEPSGKREGYVIELIDVLIRTLDLLYMTGATDVYNIDELVQDKLQFNSTRGVKHGKAF